MKTNKEKVIKLFHEGSCSDVREELMEDLTNAPDMVNDISEEQATSIIQCIRDSVNENLTIQGEDPRKMLKFMES